MLYCGPCMHCAYLSHYVEVCSLHSSAMLYGFVVLYSEDGLFLVPFGHSKRWARPLSHTMNAVSSPA